MIFNNYAPQNVSDKGKTQGASHSPNIRLVIPFTSFTPSELASPTLLNPNIMPNFKIALHNLEQLNQKSGATQNDDRKI
jgi:hypothetical protein